jgi:uncharacterized protein with ATP-grasp and redox domains
VRTYLECVPCFLSQALGASSMVTDDPAVHERVLRRTLRLVAEMPFDRPPPWMGQQIHRLVRELSGDPNPYHRAKRHSNALALQLYPTLKQRVRESPDPFATAIRLAVAGNVIDLGCTANVSSDTVHQAVEDALKAPLDHDLVHALRQALDEAQDALYLADNAGEIVFDRLLLEEVPTARIALVVRGQPVINDATREDAELAGLTSLVEVVDNGSDAPGTILDTCSAEFRERFQRSDLVIAKGQGNYETLSEEDRDIFFLLKVKCPVIARDIGCNVGQSLVCRNRRRRARTNSSQLVSGLKE